MITVGSVSAPDTHSAPRSARPGSLLPLALFLTLVSVAAVVGGYVYFRNEADEVQNDARRQLELIGKLKQEYDRAYLVGANATVRIAIAADATQPATTLVDADHARQLRGTLTVGDGPGTQFTLVFTPRPAAHHGGPTL